MFQRVFLNLGGARVVGNLYRPAGAAPFPAVVLTAKSQTEFYDSPELVSAAADAMAQHFHAHL